MKTGQIYSGDNGQRVCAACAGMTALFTLRDRSGQRMHRINAEDNAEWLIHFGRPIACECGKTTWGTL